jgi:hypothetical protein
MSYLVYLRQKLWSMNSERFQLNAKDSFILGVGLLKFDKIEVKNFINVV